MDSRWSDAEAERLVEEYAGRGVHPDMALRVYTTRLLGRDPRLVLHGGGNTSVKLRMKDFLGEESDVLCVKGRVVRSKGRYVFAPSSHAASGFFGPAYRRTRLVKRSASLRNSGTHKGLVIVAEYSRRYLSPTRLMGVTESISSHLTSRRTPQEL